MNDLKPNKPLIGEPCNGCGLCCMLAVCHTGAYMMGMVQHWGERRIDGPCPALTPRKDGSYACGLMVNPRKWLGKSSYRGEVIAKHVGNCISAGTGCDELGTDDMITDEEETKLSKILDDMRNNEEWISKVRKSVEVLRKIRLHLRP